MKISLLMPTLGREKEIKVLIKSLEIQTYQNFELIIIDQNKDNRVWNIIKDTKLKIKYIKSSQIGLSYNRNLGLKYCTGDILTLTDDDAEYPKYLLENIIKAFKKNENMDIITISTKEKNSERTIHKSPKINMKITKYNIFKTAISLTTFIKIKNKNDIQFDNLLGVGSQFGSGEETDMLLSLLHNNYKGIYLKEEKLKVYHPFKNEKNDPERFYKYALGLGAIIKKEIYLRKNYLYWYIFIKILLKPIIGIILFSNSIKREKYKKIFIGRIKGFKLYPLSNI